MLRKHSCFGPRPNTFWIEPPKFKNGKDVGKDGIEGILARGILQWVEVALKVIETIALDTSTG